MTDSNQIFRCEAGIGQRVRGVALCANDNFSARYDLDRIRGIFSRPTHKLYGESYVEKVLVLNTAKGGLRVRGCCLTWSVEEWVQLHLF